MVVLALPMSSALLLVTPRCAVSMQYGGGAPQGYGGAPQGYGGAPQGYGGDPQGYGGAPQGYGQGGGGAQGAWRLDGVYGVCGHNNHVPGQDRESYLQLPYSIPLGGQHILSRYNMMQQSASVSRAQCVVQVTPDGTATLYSIGKPATGVRSGPGGPWYWIKDRQSQVLSSGCQISLDQANPEGSVFSCQMDDGQQPGYGQQQQGGYDQQQQGGYDQQQQGGYGQQQQGGYGQQQGGYY